MSKAAAESNGHAAAAAADSSDAASPALKSSTSSNKLLSILKAKKDDAKDASSTTPAAASSPASSPPLSSSSASPASGSPSDSLGKLAFWKKRKDATPTGSRSASFTTLPGVLQNTSSQALKAATGKEDDAAGRSGLSPAAQPAVPPASSAAASSVPASPDSLPSDSTTPGTDSQSPSESPSAFSLTSPTTADVPSASLPPAQPSSSSSTSLSSGKSSYYSNSSYYSSLGGASSLAAFRQLSIGRSPSFINATAPPDSAAAVASTVAPASPRDGVSAASNTDSSGSPPKSTSPVTSPVNSPRRMPRTAALDLTLQSLSSALSSDSAGNKKLSNYLRLLQDDALSLPQLRKLAWSGIPPEVRSLVWKILLEYVPTARRRRDATLDSKRREYHGYLVAYDQACLLQSEDDIALLRQIRADIPRTSPGIGFFKREDVSLSLERCLYVFAIRHPASGYVQGMNDLVTPFYAVFVRDWMDLDVGAGTGAGGSAGTAAAAGAKSSDSGTAGGEDAEVEEDALLSLEADAYWCLSNMISGIQDHYIFAQPGIQRQVFRMREVVDRVDSQLSRHLDAQQVQFIHFAFRWMNCLLMRELPLPLIVRLWDSYLADEDATGFKTFHTYLCTALLVRFAKEIKAMEFGELIVFLQKLPTELWTEKEVETLLAQAFLYKTWFDSAPRHLQ